MMKDIHLKLEKKEDPVGFKLEHSVQPIGSIPEGQIYCAIVLENEDLDVDSHQAPTTPRRYFTRSKSSLKDEPKTLTRRTTSGVKRPVDYEEDDDEDEITSEEDYSDQDDVFVAQQVKPGTKKEKKTRNKKEFKRARRSALPWTTAESKTLSLLVNLYGAKEWQFVAKILQSKHNNNRTAAQCSQRWCRVINPTINKGAWDLREDKLLCEKYDDLQGSWCKIVKFFPDRTDTQCKRRYEKILQMRNR